MLMEHALYNRDLKSQVLCVNQTTVPGWLDMIWRIFFFWGHLTVAKDVTGMEVKKAIDSTQWQHTKLPSTKKWKREHPTKDNPHYKFNCQYHGISASK